MIYFASKTVHAAKWRELRAAGCPINSTWIDEAEKGQSRDLTDLWRRCIDESCRASVLIAYREPSEVLKGTLVEIGAALATGGPVMLVGFDDRDAPAYSFRHHTQVVICKSLEDALTRAGRHSHSCKWKHYR